MLGLFHKTGTLQRGGTCVRWARTKPIRALPVPSTQKVLRAAIFGIPNVGKSVLLNTLVKARLAAATRKRHTTRSEILGVYNHRNVQLAFYDCPGFVPTIDAKRQEMKALRDITTSTIADVDIILLMVDASKLPSLRDQDVFAEMVSIALKSAKDEIVLVLNKVDLVHPKSKLLDLTFLYVSLINGVKYGPGGEDKSELDTTTFMISALENDGVLDLKNYLITRAKPDKWILAEDHPLTDWTPEERVEEMVLENMLENCHEEIPYIANIVCRSIQSLGHRMIKIDVDIKLDSENQKRIVIGHQGRTLVKIRQATVAHLEVIFSKKVILQLWIGLKDDMPSMIKASQSSS
jgi:GTP-binding protein Era